MLREEKARKRAFDYDDRKAGRGAKNSGSAPPASVRATAQPVRELVPRANDQKRRHHHFPPPLPLPTQRFLGSRRAILCPNRTAHSRTSNSEFQVKFVYTLETVKQEGLLHIRPDKLMPIRSHKHARTPYPVPVNSSYSRYVETIIK